MPRFVAAIDQGTTSSRCILFDRTGAVAGSAQREHRQFFPQPGWVEHDPMEIWQRTCQVIEQAMTDAGCSPGDIAAVGIANQRETTVVWNRHTGAPLCPAIVWQDLRTADICQALARGGGPAAGIDRFRDRTGLPLATYFSGPKLRWMLDNVSGLRAAAIAGDALFGTIDSWLIWQLTGGQHLTDPTNASRTMLMNLGTLEWDDQMLSAMNIPPKMLPRIVPSISDGFGRTQPIGPFKSDIPIAGVLGDQQAALIGQTCFNAGESKNTYGTGCFMLLNTGPEPIASRHGLLTTVAFQRAGEPPRYALEGSVAVAGSLVQWLRDNLGIIRTSPDIEPLANSVSDNGGVYIVPAFSGLFAPHWRPDARGIIAGLTAYATKAHLAKAALEATAYQTKDVLDAMRNDSATAPPELRVDGGMAVNDALMQFQADILGLPVLRPAVRETTALGAAFAAGLTVGFWQDHAALRQACRLDRRFDPAMSDDHRAELYAGWRKALSRAMDWA
ncbi:MAG TPA: glycerol kinase GlpK [Tepidisphaeraceae bacterium]|jgi:glycerol kinase|nr:glycerol kinase GlpK [Tepidisphaeraceae bacterium]